MNAQYMGDGVYASFNLDTHEVTLTTDDGRGPTNTIHLEPSVFHAIADFRARCVAESSPSGCATTATNAGSKADQ